MLMLASLAMDGPAARVEMAAVTTKRIDNL